MANLQWRFQIESPVLWTIRSTKNIIVHRLIYIYKFNAIFDTRHVVENKHIFCNSVLLKKTNYCLVKTCKKSETTEKFYIGGIINS